MNSSRTISKSNASFPKYLSFGNFRQQGIKHCQDLASDLWTDFNLHDPGLTILEVLCYALTDLGYRTNLPIEDLLARSAAEKGQSSGELTGKPFDDNFFTPEQILTCNPVTLLDLRKLLIDVPGVKNAWIERADAPEVKMYLDTSIGALNYEVPEKFLDDDKAIDAATVRPDGLYTVCLELEDREVADACGNTDVPLDRILKDVRTVMHQHRNLCEDFIDVVVLGNEDIALCADIELEASAVADDVLLRIQEAVEAFLSPELTFYSLQQMLENGKSIEEIYAGRPLTPLSALSGTGPGFSHGFIDTKELEKIERPTRLHVSDLYQVIMDVVPGVLAVRKLLAVNYVNDLPQTRGEKWCLHLTPKHRLRFDIARSRIQFFKGLLTVAANREVVEQRREDKRKASTKGLLEPYQLDLEVPEGTYRSNLQDYRSIIHEFPLVYGIGDGALPKSATAERQAQSLQLRAYLLFYDQILANYLAQLANLRELFSMRPDDERATNRTYYTQLLSDIPEVQKLLKNYNQCQTEDGYPEVPENYPDYLNYLTESNETYYLRRNRFLNHLLARFAESFTDYVLLMFDVNGGSNDDAQIVRDKAQFLSTYPQTSRDRGKAFDYTKPDIWGSDNVSGLEKRVSRLLGLRNLDHKSRQRPEEHPVFQTSGRTLSHTRVVEVPGGWHWQVPLSAPGEGESTTLMGRKRYLSREEAEAGLEEFTELARDERSYRRFTYTDIQRHGFALVSEDGEVNSETDLPLASMESRDLSVYKLMQLAIGGAVQCELEQESECFFFVLLDGEESSVLFEANRGLGTETEASAAFENLFLPAAGDWENYVDIDGETFGFELQAGSAGELVATHPYEYASSEERRLRKLAILRYINRPDIETRIDGEPGAFEFTVRDMGGHILFESAEVCTDREAAERSYEELLELVHHARSYRSLNEPGGERPYGFEVVGDDGPVRARHPERYETAVARDLVILSLLRMFCPTDDVRHVVREQDDAFSFALLAEDGTELLVSAQSCPSEEEARKQVSLMLMAASSYEQYIRISDEGAYGFVLHDFEDRPLAVHTATYARAPERELALRGIINYVRPASVTYSIEGENGRFTYYLLDPDDQEQFRGSHEYPDQESAGLALEDFLELAVNEACYYRIDQPGSHGFDLRKDGEVKAIHPKRYTTADEREAAIALIIVGLRRDKTRYRIDNPTGAYRFELRDQTGREILRGMRVYGSVHEAECGYQDMLNLARDRSRYRRLDDGPGGCPFGLELLDETGEVMATHPRHYVTVEGLDVVLREIYALVNEAGTLPPAIGSHDEHRIELVDHQEEILLRGTGRKQDQNEARTFFDKALLAAKSLENYDSLLASGEYTFQLRYKGEIIAQHPGVCDTAAKRDIAIKRTLFTARSRGRPYTIVDQGDHTYTFEYRSADETDAALAGSERASTIEAAMECLLASYERAVDFSAYVRENGGPGFGYRLVDAEKKTIATHPKQYTTRKARDAALQAWIDSLKTQALEPKLTPVPVFYYQLVDFNGRVVLKSEKTWLSATLAEKAYKYEFAPLATQVANYESAYDNETCQYTFSLWRRSGQSAPARVASHPATYPVPRLRDEQIQYAIELVSASAPAPVVTGTACGYFFRLSANTLEATTRYPDPSSTASACTSLLAGMASSEAYLILDAGEDAYQLLVSNEDGTVRGASALGNFEDIVCLRDTLLELASEDVPIPHSILESRNEFRCRLTDGNGLTLLESRAGYSAEVLAYMDGFDARLNRDRAMGTTRDFFLETPDATPRIEEVAGDYYYFIFDVGEGLELRGRWAFASPEEAEDAARELLAVTGDEANYRIADTAYPDSAFELFNKTKAEGNRQLACDSCDAFVERILSPDGFRLIAGLAGCAYAFELLGTDGTMVASYRQLFPSPVERDAHLQAIRRLVDHEGFHLVEHLLLRPRESGLDAAYSFAIPDPNSELALLRATVTHASSQAAIQVLKGILDGITGGLDIVSPVNYGDAYSFIVIGTDGEAVASPEADFCSEAERDDAQAFFLNHIAAVFADPGTRTPEALEEWVFDLRTDRERRGDALIPLGGGCRDASGKLSAALNEPYGFRVTVVVPYWPRRFRNPDFRPFFERTLRLETPAHIFPRICWVDVCQMNEFEDAYRRWLKAMARPTNHRDRKAMARPTNHCDRSAAQSALIDILFKLRSVYSTGRLSDCTTDGVTNPVRLDQTLLGTAGENHGDTP